MLNIRKTSTCLCSTLQGDQPFLYVCVHGGRKRALDPPEMELHMDGDAVPRGCWEQNQSPLKEQLVCLSLQRPRSAVF